MEEKDQEARKGREHWGQTLIHTVGHIVRSKERYKE